MRFLITIALLLTGSNAMAGLLVSNWSATPTTLTFDITGTIDAGTTFGPDQKSSLFIGPANLGEQAGAMTTYGTWVSLGGTPTQLQQAALFNDEDGAKLQVRKYFFQDWAVGDILNYSFSISGANLVDLSGWDPTGAIVSVGRDIYANAPEPAYQVGTFASAVPEPATLALFGLGIAGIGWSRRKKA